MSHAGLYCPKPGYRSFEITLHNQEVRELVKTNRQHGIYADLWADDKVTVVEARDADDARAILAKRYPPDAGFVISRISPL